MIGRGFQDPNKEKLNLSQLAIVNIQLSIKRVTNIFISKLWTYFDENWRFLIVDCFNGLAYKVINVLSDLANLVELSLFYRNEMCSGSLSIINSITQIIQSLNRLDWTFLLSINTQEYTNKGLLPYRIFHCFKMEGGLLNCFITKPWRLYILIYLSGKQLFWFNIPIVDFLKAHIILK